MRKEEYLELGMLYVREGNLDAAHRVLQQSVAAYTGVGDVANIQADQIRDRVPLELLSYYGLCLAVLENRVQEAVSLCEYALSREVLRPDFYLNLGKVYLRANEKARALEVFRAGLEIYQNDWALRQEVQRMGIRGRQILGFLPRSHFLNRYLGLLFHRLRHTGRAGLAVLV